MFAKRRDFAPAQSPDNCRRHQLRHPWRGIIAHGFHCQLGDALLNLGTLDFEDRAFRPRPLPLAFSRQCPQFGIFSAVRSTSNSAILREKSADDDSGSPFSNSPRAISRNRSMAFFDRATPAMPERSLPSKTWQSSSLCLVRRPDFSPVHAHLQKHFVNFVAAINGDDGRTVMPGVFMSMSRKEMPSWRFSPDVVRTRQNIQSACWAKVVQILWPLTHIRRPQARLWFSARQGRNLRRALNSPDTTSLHRTKYRAKPNLFALIAKGVNHRSKHLHAERHGRNSAVTGAFFVENIALRDRPVRAAKFCRPARCNPAFGVQNFVPSQQVFLGHVTAVQRTQMLRVVFFNKGPHFSRKAMSSGVKSTSMITLLNIAER